jgi:murein DD-endopeptidase MepM/ murein hydrolase activator NlpD
VLSAGWDGGGGKTVKVRHSGGYVTNYLHLSRFNTRAGARVSQGDVIGYVGQTGLASGPHLDYRVKRNGTWVNPTNLGGVQAEPIATAELPRFRSERDLLRSTLESREPSAPVAPPTVVASQATSSDGLSVARR